jgi:O-antigen ligase
MRSPRSQDLPSADASSSRQAVVLLQVYAFTTMVFPSNAVFRPIGGYGFIAGLIAMFAFAGWAASTFLGFHNPLDHRHPTRAAIIALWMVTLISYAFMALTERNPADRLAADRWLMQVAAISGIVLVAAECLNSLHNIKRVLRALVWGGAFCGVVAALQFFLHRDISPWLRSIPGFTILNASAGIDYRGGVSRVAGTAMHPIELGVVASMLLPLAIYLLVYDVERRPWKRLLPTFCIAIAIPASVSRSAVVAIILGLGIFVILLPSRQRVVALAAAPFAVAGIFLTARGFISTITRFFLAGHKDTSISHRTDNYPYVEQLVRQAPLFGHGGGTYAPGGLHILDNQYLKSMIELGVVGVCVLIFFVLLPVFTALVARWRTSDPDLRVLCGALAGSAIAAAVCSATFDSLSFPMFASVEALVVGLVGACWRLASGEPNSQIGSPAHPSLSTIKPFAPHLVTNRIGIQGS